MKVLKMGGDEKESSVKDKAELSMYISVIGVIAPIRLIALL